VSGKPSTGFEETFDWKRLGSLFSTSNGSRGVAQEKRCELFDFRGLRQRISIQDRSIDLEEIQYLLTVDARLGHQTQGFGAHCVFDGYQRLWRLERAIIDELVDR
jgi:hypothetical protein